MQPFHLDLPKVSYFLSNPSDFLAGQGEQGYLGRLEAQQHSNTVVKSSDSMSLQLCMSRARVAQEGMLDVCKSPYEAGIKRFQSQPTKTGPRGRLFPGASMSDAIWAEG